MQHDPEQAELGDFKLGPFEVYPSQSLLRHIGTANLTEDTKEQNPGIHLEPKVMAVLERLAREPLQVVSRHSLLDDVWTGTVVTEEVVTRCISELRTALGDSSKAPRFIQTIPKKGYKLLQAPAPLEAARSTSPAQAPEPGSTDNSLLGSVSRPASTPAGQGRPGLYWALVGSLIIAAMAVGAAAIMFLQERAPVTADPVAIAELSPEQATPSIAILPFATLDSGAESNYFGAGLAEELLNALANVPGLRVVSRLAAADARLADTQLAQPVSPIPPGTDSRASTVGGDVSAIGKTLGVDNVLTGSVRRMNNQVRVTAQLVRTSDGVLLWADQFEGDLSDVFQIQDEIAAAIVGALRLQLTEPVRVARISQDMDALDYYLLGRHHWHQRTADSLRRAIELFQQAVSVDPEMAIAYSGLADAYLLLADYGNMAHEEAQALARPAIETALRLDANLAEAHASQGMFYLSTGQAEPAERALRNAVRLNPGYNMAHMWLGSTIAMRGQVKAAHKYYLKAYRLDPLHPVINQNVAMSFATIGDYDSAQTILQKLDPRFDSGQRLTFLKLHLAQQLGDFATLRDLADAAIKNESLKLRLSGYHALWQMHSRQGQYEAAADYLRRARSESELDFEFRLNVARKLAKEGAAKEFKLLMQEAPDYFHEKAAPQKRALEGMLLIATENYIEAATLLESAMTASDNLNHPHPASELLTISHLLYVYEQTDNIERRDYWQERGNKVIAAAIKAGYGQIEFITEVGFFHAAAGQAEAASKAFWQALTLGKIAPWEITDDIRINRIQRSKELAPVVAQAARTWTA